MYFCSLYFLREKDTIYTILDRHYQQYSCCRSASIGYGEKEERPF